MKVIYLEPDEEITSVIDRIAKIDDREVAIVVPRRAGLLQSIINLKLLRYQSEQQKKRLSIVTNDKTGRNLASAVGLTVYQKIPEGSSEAVPQETKPQTAIPVTLKPSTRKAAPAKPTRPAEPRIIKRQLSEEAADHSPELVAIERAAEKVGLTESETEPTPDTRPAPKPPPKIDKRPRRSLGERLPGLPKPSLPKFNLPAVRLPKRLKVLRTGLLAAVILALLLTFIVPTFAFARATVTVSLQAEQIALEVPITFSVRGQSPNDAGAVVPAKTIEIDKPVAVEQPATGTKQSGNATGTITISNRLATPQGLIARTRFVSPDGKVYRIQSSVTVPGRGSVRATAIADDPGDAGNLAAGATLTLAAIPNSAVTASADTAITGTTAGGATVVSADDVERAKAALAKKAAGEGLADAKGKLAVGYKLDEQVVAANVTAANPNPPVGTDAAKFTVSGTVHVTYFTYEETTLDRALKSNLQGKVPPGSELTETTSQTFTPGTSSADTISGTVKVTGATAPTLAKEELKQKVAGKTAEEAAVALRDSETTQEATVALSPFWIRHVPKSTKKIIIKYRTELGPSGSPRPAPTMTPTSAPAVTVTPAAVPATDAPRNPAAPIL